MTPQAIEEKYGVTPTGYAELAALVGETSDNLPGVPGVGPKTAAKWLTEYDGLENLIRRADQVPGKAGASFREHLEDVRRNKRLNALVRDLDLTITIGDLARGNPNQQAVNELFDVLQFRALRDRVRELYTEPVPTPAPVAMAPVTAIAVNQGAAWLAQHGSGQAGLEVSRSRAHGFWDAEAVTIAAADGAIAWFDIAYLSPADDSALGAWLANPAMRKIVHNAKQTLLALQQRGWDLTGVVCDTELAAYLVNPDRRVFDLPTLTERYLNRTLDLAPSAADEQPAFDFEDHPQMDTAGLAARALADLAEPLEADLKTKGATALLSDIEIPLTRVLANMETTGIAIDQPFLATLHRQFDDRVGEAERLAWQSLGHETNLSSPKQLQIVLFEELKMPKTRRTKSGYTTDAEALERLYVETAHPFLEHLLAHRDQIRLRQTVEGLIKAIGEDGRIHTTYLQTVAATGRLSSADPNLQNIPTRTPAGQQIRQAFVAGEGYDSLMTADYSQIEMRIMAHLSGDVGLIEAFRSGQDFHTVMASHVFHTDPKGVTPAERSRVKAVNYGLAYGLSAYGLSNQLRIPVTEARRLMDEYFEHFGGVRDYLTALVAQARNTGYTETLLGRRRYLADLGSANRTRREMAERMALNAPIQGSAADIIKLAMLKVAPRLHKDFRSRLLLQVHDELVFEIAPGEQASLEAMVREAMAEAIELSVPLEISVGVGPTWASAAH
jgi:DNA polymerase-1